MLTDGPGGSTNYQAGLDAINTSWTDQGVDSSASNNVIFLSDGVQTSGDTFTDEATALSDNFGANISAVGVGVNAMLTGGLNEMDNTGGSIGSQDGAVQVTDASQLADVINSPPPIVDVDSVTVNVTYDDPDNPGETLTYTETIPVGDSRLTETPSGYVLNDTVFTFSPAPPPGSTATIEIVTTFNDGSDTISSGEVQIPSYICFARGTLIETPNGPVSIENLAEGDLVLTRDNGPQPIRWMGSIRLKGGMLLDKQRPICIQAHALAPNTPSQELFVSPQHRILVRSRIALKMFGTNEVLVAAKQLCLLDGIDVAHDVQEVEYFHMLFDQHEVITSNGAETESLYTGPEALKSVGKAAQEEIFALFPKLRERDYAPVAVRPLAPGRMGRKLAARHRQNNKRLITSHY